MIFFFFPIASFNSLQIPVYPSKPHCSGHSEPNNPRSPQPHTVNALKYRHTQPRGRSSLYLLRSRPEGSAVSSYTDIFMETGELSFIKTRAVILSATCSRDTGVQRDTYQQEGYQENCKN